VTSDDVRSKIRSYVISHFHLARTRQLRDEDSLLDAQVIDSLGILELVAYLEDAFAIAVTDDDLTAENFDSIAALARFVANRCRRRDVPAPSSARRAALTCRRTGLVDGARASPTGLPAAAAAAVLREQGLARDRWPSISRSRARRRTPSSASASPAA
jgi:acyl carrier protein